MVALLRRPLIVAVPALLLILVIVAQASFGARPTSAQNTGPQGTIAAQQTALAVVKATSAARGQKINAQRTQIADQKTQIANLAAQVPPTMTPTPELSGKDAYTWLADPREILTRPYDHLGEKWVFCGSVLSIAVAPSGRVYTVGDTKEKQYSTLIQVYPDGYTDPFMIGFQGSTENIYEDSHICIWGTLVDTASGTNGFGGSIVNPLFSAEFVELG